MDGARQVFAVITNGYSDDSMTSDQEVLMAITSGFDNIKTIFIAREDSSVKNARGTHTNEEVSFFSFNFFFNLLLKFMALYNLNFC